MAASLSGVRPWTVRRDERCVRVTGSAEDEAIVRFHDVDGPLQSLLLDQDGEPGGVLHQPIAGRGLVGRLEATPASGPRTIRTRASKLNRRAATSARDRMSTAQSVKSSTGRV